MMQKCIMVKIGEEKDGNLDQITEKPYFFAKIGEKFLNFAEIGGTFYDFCGNGGICNMHHRLRGMDALGVRSIHPEL